MSHRVHAGLLLDPLRTIQKPKDLATALGDQLGRRRGQKLAIARRGHDQTRGNLGNALRHYLRYPAFVEPFMSLPLAILPTFVVPIVIVSHVLLFSWARSRESSVESARVR